MMVLIKSYVLLLKLTFKVKYALVSVEKSPVFIRACPYIPAYGKNRPYFAHIFVSFLTSDDLLHIQEHQNLPQLRPPATEPQELTCSAPVLPALISMLGEWWWPSADWSCSCYCERSYFSWKLQILPVFLLKKCSYFLRIFTKLNPYEEFSTLLLVLGLRFWS